MAHLPPPTVPKHLKTTELCNKATPWFLGIQLPMMIYIKSLKITVDLLFPGYGYTTSDVPVSQNPKTVLSYESVPLELTGTRNATSDVFILHRTWSFAKFYSINDPFVILELTLV